MSFFSAERFQARGAGSREPPHEEPAERAYKPLLEIGRGGMGVVTLALARGPERFAKLVVLKRLHEHLGGDAESVQMLLDEARICARVSHPNVVQVYEATLDGGVPTIVMEFLEGQPLSALLEGPTPLPLHLHLAILCQVLRGLDAAHEVVDYDGKPLHLVHRDMSPHNVFVGYDATVKVVDFGIAKTVGTEGATRTGVLKGKLRYMAPEQVSGAEIDRRIDLFSVGVMLWEAICGRRMWGDEADGYVIRALVERRIPPLTCARVDARLARVCERALAADPAQRYQTAGEFRRELQKCLGERTGVLEEELGAFMAKHFGAQRDETRARIAERINRRTSNPPAETATGRAGRRSMPAERRWGSRPRGVALVAVCGAALIGGVSLYRLPMSHSGPALPGAPTQIECEPGMKSCDGRCVSTGLPEHGCSSAGCAPCSTANATPRCGRDGACDIAACYRGYDDCDGVAANGCETSLRTDPDHCGACSRACSALPHAEAGCGDVCRIWRCEPGFEDCNGLTDDGCEANVATDRQHCGACGQPCSGRQRCQEGRCV